MEEYSIDRSYFVARAASWVVLILALLGLAGFLLNAPFLAGSFLKSIPMAPSTALCFMLLDGALLLWQDRHPWGRRAIQTAAALVLLVSAGVLLKRLQAAGQMDAIILWKMSPYTAGLFMLSAAGLLRLGRLKTGSDPAATAIGCALLVSSSVILTGYLYGSPFFYGGTGIPVAFATGLAFAALSVALLASARDSGSAALFLGPTLKAVLLRNFMPLIVLAIFGDGLIDVWGGGILGSKPLEHVVYSIIALAAGVWLASRISTRIAARVGRTEAELRENEAKYRTLYVSSRDALMTLFPPGWSFTSGNPATIEMFGAKDEADFVARGPWELSPEYQPDGELSSVKAKRMIGTALEKGAHLFEWTHKRIGGPAFPATVLLTRFELGGKTGLQATVRNIAAQKLLEENHKKTGEQLLQSQKMDSVGRLAGGIAHDFNNILTAINGYAGFLLRSMGPGAPGREDAEGILNAADKAAALTRQLLAFSHKQILRPECLDLNELVRNMGKMLSRLVSDSYSVGLELAPELPAVKADPGQLEQVLMNLVVNARDAMPGGGGIVIETAGTTVNEVEPAGNGVLLPGRYVLLCVKDSGTGIPAEIQSRIFEPFFTTKEQGKGTGLGLSTAYGIIKQSGGHIFVDSKPGAGSVFSVYLPVCEEPLHHAQTCAAAPEGCGGTETILLAEDEEQVRAVMGRLLRYNGYTVLEAADGLAALELFSSRGGEISLLLTDLMMPGLNGLELFRRLKAARPGLKVIYTSGYTDEVGELLSDIDGGAEFLQKPVKPEDLLYKIREVLGHGAK